jgi:AraC family transcriptional regulator
LWAAAPQRAPWPRKSATSAPARRDARRTRSTIDAVIVTTRFPDLPPGPETAANAEFRARFRAGWGRVESVFLARSARVEAGPLPSAWSIKLALEGTAELQLGRRRLRLEHGRFLLVNPGHAYRVRIDQPALCFSLHFGPALVREVAASQGLGWDAALDGADPTRPEPLWREQLQRDDDAALRPWLARIRARVTGAAAGAHEEDFVELLACLLARECRERQRSLARLSAQRAVTRDELLRRLGWASDFIESHYREPIGLAQMAAAAHLSKFHFLRAFRELHGRTPADHLRARRAEAVRRARAAGVRDVDALLAASGFGSRWSLQRALRDHGATHLPATP